MENGTMMGDTLRQTDLPEREMTCSPFLRHSQGYTSG